MQNILWIGEPYFAAELENCGFENIHVLAPAGALYSWNDLVRLAGFTPELVVVADTGGAPFVLGMEDFPCLTIFYSVYSHIHAWHRLYAQGFDACIVTQGGDAAHFGGAFLNPSRIWYMPPFAPSHADETGEYERKWDCLYLTNPTNPGNLSFGEALCARIPRLTARPGNPAQMYRQARIVTHHVDGHPGLDFSMFEIMASGACLVTPRVGHGMSKLFVDGEHFVQYKYNDAGDAAHHVNFLLEHPELVKYIAQKGKAEIDACHRAVHRAWTFTDHVLELATYDAQAIITERRSNASAVRLKCLSVPYVLCSRQTQGWQRAAYMAAARGKFGLDGINS